MCIIISLTATTCHICFTFPCSASATEDTTRDGEPKQHVILVRWPPSASASTTLNLTMKMFYFGHGVRPKLICVIFVRQSGCGVALRWRRRELRSLCETIPPPLLFSTREWRGACLCQAPSPRCARRPTQLTPLMYQPTYLPAILPTQTYASIFQPTYLLTC